MSHGKSSRPGPRVSVIVEGYNESIDLGAIDSTVEALRRQCFPLGDVEVILLGTTGQVAAWRERLAGEHTFHGVQYIAADDCHYFELKNMGADTAAGEIIAFTDS